MKQKNENNKKRCWNILRNNIGLRVVKLQLSQLLDVFCTLLIRRQRSFA